MAGRSTKPAQSTAPTMLDVAAAAGVSVATVSAVVNGKPIVSATLAERVEEAIRATGYKRNAAARNLKLGSTRTVGLSVADITNPFFTDVVSLIQSTLHGAGYAVMLCCNDSNAEAQDDQIQLLIDRGVDGLIIAPACDDENLRRVLGATRAPVVLIDRDCDGVEADAVVLDNRRASQEAIEYLISLGHRRIGFISGSLDTSTGRDRLGGYRDALSVAGLGFDDALVRVGNFREGDAYNAAMELLAAAPRPTALFAANNLMVIGAMKAVRDFGLSCPQDVSVACFDDFPWADVFSPQLTTVAQPVRGIAEQASRLLLERMTGQTAAPPRRLVMRGRLIVRSSCRLLRE